MKPKDVRHTTPHMMTAEDRLRFAVRFAQMDLDTLRPGDWLNLEDDILAFLAMRTNDHVMGEQVGFAIPKQRTASSAIDAGAIDAYIPLGNVPLVGFPQGEAFQGELSLSSGEYRALQADVRAWLYPLSRFGTPLLPGVSASCVSLQVDIRFFADRHWAYGGMRQLFIHRLYVSLLLGPWDRIRACPECETIFYRVKQQAYCSRTCGNRATQRRWREKHEAGASPIA